MAVAALFAGRCEGEVGAEVLRFFGTGWGNLADAADAPEGVSAVVEEAHTCGYVW